MQSSNQSPLYAGNGNFPSRDGRPKRQLIAAETEPETRRMPEKPHSGAISASRPVGVRALKTGWWPHQGSNLGPDD